MRKMKKVVIALLTVCLLTFETMPMNVLAETVNTVVEAENVPGVSTDTVSGNEEMGEENITTGTLGANNGVVWSYNADTKNLTITGEDSKVYGWRGVFADICSDVENIIVQDCKLNGDISGLFMNLVNLKNIQFMNFITSDATRMDSMFEGCSSLESLDVSSFNTSNVKYMSSMFWNCNGLKSLDVSNFDTSNVTGMNFMFADCSNLESLDVSNFDTGNVTSMDYIFLGCSNLESLDVSNFDTGKVANMEGMFRGCSNLISLELGNFNTSNVINMSYMFWSCNGLKSLDLSNFDTGNVTDMKLMFDHCSNLESLNLSNFNTGNVTDMTQMFFDCSNLKNLNLSSFNTSNVINMMSMFSGCSSLERLDLSNFDTGNVTRMHSMFMNCSNIKNLDLSNFDTSNVTDMFWMFSGCSNLESLNISNFDTSNVTSMDNMFSNYDTLAAIYTPKIMMEEQNVKLSGNYFDTTSGSIVNKISQNTCNTILLKTYNINYVLNGGIQNLNNPEYYVKSEENIMLSAPTREGYQFMGWYRYSDFSEEVQAVAAGSIGNITLYAKWQEIPAQATDITLNITSLSMKIGETHTFVAVMTPSNTTDIITWKSSDSKVAKVDENGVVTAISGGTATITATTTSGKTATCKVTVKVKEIPATKIKLNKTKVTLNKGKTLTLKATLTPASSTDTVKWTSSKKSIAKVTGNGKKATVTALKKGTTTITAKTSSGKKVTCKVTVKEIKATKIKLNKTKVTIKKGKSLTLKATLTPKNSTDAVTWTSSSKKVAKVSNKGKVTALKKGTATITAKTSSGKKVTCKVTVK